MADESTAPFMTGEHWRQWIATLGPMIVFTLGIAYWVIGAINSVHEDSMKAAQVVSEKVTVDEGRVLADEGRIAALEHALEDLKSENRSFQTQTGTTLSQIVGSLSDLRVSVARDGHPGRGP